MGKDKVAYFYDSDVGGAYYGAGHPMKPHRVVMTHHLVLGYELHKHMEVFRPRPATYAELLSFHDARYIQYLGMVTPDNINNKEHGFVDKQKEYGFSMIDDCPAFFGLFDFCRLYTGASLEGARKLNHGLCDIAINWAGGLHHAKKASASGFCYVNDLVIAILELLKHHARVLYVDIDVHHGDGVEEAFYLSDRVMTVSFHQYGLCYFPGTGPLDDIGEQRGKFYSLNVPLRAGVTDSTFHSLFKPIMARVMEVYNPSAIVFQSGADSIAYDRLGCANLSIEGHGEALAFMKRFKVPMLVTGGGGYTKSNVARCWTYETALLVDQEISDHLPRTECDGYFVSKNPHQCPSHQLNARVTKDMSNDNDRGELELIKMKVMENLRHLEHTPAVQMHYAPKSELLPDWDVIEDEQKLEERLIGYARRHRLLSNPAENGEQDQGRELRLFHPEQCMESAFVY